MSSAPAGQPRWILSFADLLSVILSFLVLSYSMQLPAAGKHTGFDKAEDADFSIKKSLAAENINLTKSDQNLSTDYLFVILQKKIKSDADLAKLSFTNDGDSITLALSREEFTLYSSKIAQFLKVLDNQVWLYSPSLDVSEQSYALLKEKGMDKKITFLESPTPNGQIDIVIYP